MTIVRPTLLINSDIAIRNIRRMTRKFHSMGIRFRPHFKTHQSLDVGRWFRDEGIQNITVTSVDMAARFASDGWRDILIAMPFNPGETEEINHFPPSIRLNLLFDHPHAVRSTAARLKRPVDVWIKIDTGYGRCGLEASRPDQIVHLGKEILGKTHFSLRGILTHAGHTYHASDPPDITRIHEESMIQLKSVRDQMEKQGFPGLEISIGDTPACSHAVDFSGIQEVRCGNFVYYDIMQTMLGSCRIDDIAVRLLCPVIGTYPGRGEVVIRGGKVHLSGDAIIEPDGTPAFGLVAPCSGENSWAPPMAGARVRSLSQEHGIVHVGREKAESLKPGDCLAILPVHSCLTADLATEVRSVQGDSLDTPRQR